MSIAHTHGHGGWSVTLSLCCVAEVTNLLAITWRLEWTIFPADLSLLDLSIPVVRAFAVRSTGLPGATCGNACYGLCAFNGLYPFMDNHLVTE